MSPAPEVTALLQALEGGEILVTTGLILQELLDIKVVETIKEGKLRGEVSTVEFPSRYP